MSKKTLNLGATLSEILKLTNSNFTELYNAIAKVQEANADGAVKAGVYSSLTAMITGLNAGKDEQGNALALKLGDEIYIVDDNSPDFWISDVLTSSSTGTMPDGGFVKGVTYTFGKYQIRVSNTREIQLEDYQRKDKLDALALGNDESEQIALIQSFFEGNVEDDRYPSSKLVAGLLWALEEKASAYQRKDNIDKLTNGINENSSDEHYPSSKLLYSIYNELKGAINSKLDSNVAAETYQSKEGLLKQYNELDLDDNEDLVNEAEAKEKYVSGYVAYQLRREYKSLFNVSTRGTLYGWNFYESDERWTTYQIDGVNYAAIKLTFDGALNPTTSSGEKRPIIIDVLKDSQTSILYQAEFEYDVNTEKYTMYICIDKPTMITVIFALGLNWVNIDDY